MQIPGDEEKIVKKNVLFVSLCVMMLMNAACTKTDYRKVANDFITASTPLKDFTIREVADTSSANWKAVIVYAKQGTANVPIVLFVSADGKSIVPNSMVYADNKPIFTRRLEPELGKIDFKLAEKDRFVYNPAGTKTIFMFSDPDCPYCKKAKEKLENYNGEYRVVVKYFPLEQIHPGATRKAVGQEAQWLKEHRKDLTGDAAILKEADRIVQEDIAEGQKAGISGVPTYVMEDGTLKQGVF